MIVALGALLSMIGGVVTAAPALAGGRGDGWQVFPLPPTFTEPADHCGFPIQGTQDVANVFVKVLKTVDGSTIFLATGAAKITFTNPDNGKSISVNASGPGKFIANADGSVIALGKGLQAIGLSPAEQALTGLPGQFVSAGALTATADANGNLTSLTLQGHILVNICAALSWGN